LTVLLRDRFWQPSYSLEIAVVGQELRDRARILRRSPQTRQMWVCIDSDHQSITTHENTKENQ
jgi:hypothetical protein